MSSKITVDTVLNKMQNFRFADILYSEVVQSYFYIYILFECFEEEKNDLQEAIGDS